MMGEDVIIHLRMRNFLAMTESGEQRTGRQRQHPKACGLGENSKPVSDLWEHTNKKLGNLVCAGLQSQPVLKINSWS